MKLTWKIIFLLLFISKLSAQNYLGNYTSHSIGDNGARIFAGTASIQISFFDDDLVKVDFLPFPNSVPDSSYVIIRQVLNGNFLISESDTSLIISTSKLRVDISKSPVRLRFLSGSGEIILGESQSGGFYSDGNQRGVNFRISSDYGFYGTGERGTDLNKYGMEFESYNRQIFGYNSALPTMNINVPFISTTGGYGIYFENIYPGHFDIGSTDPYKLTYDVSGGELSYVVLIAESIQKQLELYTWLTGKQPLLPKWAFGYIQSKYGYQNENEARDMLQTMRSEGIPCDAIVLDLYWFNQMGDLSWDFQNWSDPYQMMRDFLDIGIKTIAITEPYITQFSSNYGPAVAGQYAGFSSDPSQPYIIPNWWSCNCDAVLLDLSNPDARDWWWDKYPPFMGEEMAGLWTDLGEPENHPPNMNHYLGNSDKIHNIYNFLWAETIYGGWQNFRPNQRLLNLTRSGYAGIQRYSVVTWSADVAKSFQALDVQKPMLLNMGMSGLAYHNSDIGGFCCGFTTPELYVRWMQFGTFCPVTRAHGVGQPTEPFEFGTQAENICREYIQLRYRLIPYLYTAAYDNHKTGMPIVRPLLFADPDDINLINYSDAYLFGDAIIVAPVTGENQFIKDVYLPAGKWVYFWNDQVYSGGGNYQLNTPLDVMPLFLREGAIIPMQPDMQFTDEMQLDTLILAVYPFSGVSSSYTLYEDDGKTLDYQSGQFALTTISQNQNSTDALEIEIGSSNGNYSGKPPNRTYLLDIHLMHASPNIVASNGMYLTERSSYGDLRNGDGGYYYNSINKRLYVQTGGSTDSSYNVRIEGILLRNDDAYANAPADYSLERNYPNPFNASTNIPVRISTNGLITPERVNLSVYDLLGNRVAVIVNDELSPGTYEFRFNGSRLSSGVYFYRLSAGDKILTRKMILLK